MCDEEYTRKNCQTIMENRSWTTEELKKRGFALTDSKTNFVFAKHPAIDGEALYRGLKARGVLVRHFSSPRICDYNRITIGSMAQMERLMQAIDEILA